MAKFLLVALFAICASATAGATETANFSPGSLSSRVVEHRFDSASPSAVQAAIRSLQMRLDRAQSQVQSLRQQLDMLNARAAAQTPK